MAAIYPEGMHAAIADGVRQYLENVTVRTTVLQDPEHGLPAETLAMTDVLCWWGHRAHAAVDDRVVDRIEQRVREGMGLIVLHSGHYSKIFKRLMGSPCSLIWRVAGERERLWVCDPAHPIAAGLPASFDLDHEEMYGEPFAIPAPEQQVFISSFAGGEVFRSGCCWQRGQGRVFYFRPGHEIYPTYFDPNVRRVIANAAGWCGRRSG